MKKFLTALYHIVRNLFIALGVLTATFLFMDYLLNISPSEFGNLWIVYQILIYIPVGIIIGFFASKPEKK